LDALGETMVARRSIPVTVLVILVVVMFLVTSVGTALGQDRPDSTEDERVPNAVQQGGEGVQPQVTPYYVKATSGSAVARGQLSPVAIKMNDTLAEIQVPGPTFPRRTLSRAGIFDMQISLQHPLEIYGINHVSVWAKSNEDAQNAEFRILYQRNGGTVENMYTNQAMLSNVPLEFSVPNPPSFTEPLVFRTGDTMSIEIQYRASPRYFVGPAPSCILLANSIAHQTRIELLARPLDCNISAPVFGQEGEHKVIQVNGRIWDSYAVDPENDLIVGLSIQTTGSGNIPASTIRRMNFAPREEEIVINWTWDYKKSVVTDGLFEFKIDISYGVVGHNYTNSSFFELEFPKQKKDDTGVLGGMSLMQVGIIAVLIIAGVAIVFWRRSRTSYYSGYADPRGPPKRPKKAKKPKLSKKQKKMIAAKKGMPPPGSPPRSPDRTPMPGRGPPGGGAPPPRAPGAPRGAPRPGPSSARPRR
jgi:hypothetical protein